MMRNWMILAALVTVLALMPGVTSAAPPDATSMLPSTGNAAGGYLTVITGSGFASGTTVRFGANFSSNVTVAGTTAIIATVPAGVAGTSVTILITNPDGTTAVVPILFTYNAVPPVTVTVFSPTTVAVTGGTLVTVSGSGFMPDATVLFGTTPGTSVSVIDSTTLTVMAPAGVLGSAGTVRVSNPNGASGIGPGAFFFSGSAGTTTGTQPTISTILPNTGSAAGGTSVTINGSGFTPGVTVSFGGVPMTNVNVVSSTQITLTAPSGAVGVVPVTVTSPYGFFGGLLSGFTYLVATPQLTSVAPTEGLLVGGTPITITGSGFVVGATVTIGGQSVRNVAVTSPTSITGVTPPSVPGTAVVLVTNPGGLIAGLASGFTYSATAAPPSSSLVVTGVSPASGPMTGGERVTIFGQGFTAGAVVTIGGVPATNVTVLGPTQILASTPAASVAGAATVVVTINNLGNALSRAFTYTSATGGGTTTTPPPVQASGITPGSSGLFVFGGGTNAQLAVASGCPATRLVLWATDAKGQWVGYIPTAPAMINVSWDALFPNEIPAGTAIYVRCS